MKSLRWFLLVTLVLALVVAVAPVRAQQDGEWDGWSCQGYASMLTGTYPAIPGIAFGAFGAFQEAVYTITVEAVGGDAVVSLITDPSGNTVLAGPSSTPVTFTYTMPAPGSQPVGLGVIVNSASGEVMLSISASCGLAGCDAQIALPADAVVGSFVDNASIYWAPGELASPAATITAGNTYWVAGQDATGTFRKILLSCSWVWVEADKVGPNYDAVWNGAPLPTTVVE